MSQNISLWNAIYSAVPAVNLPKQGGGTARFTDVTDTTASASDVASTKYFYTSSGVRTQGTASGGGGQSGLKKGTLTVSSNVNTSTNTKITDTSTIGFTPSAFMFYRSGRSATSNHVNYATFVTLGTYYVRTRTRYSSNALSTSGDTNNWTTQTSGYLYFNSNNVYFRSSSSNILASGTWNWVAIQ